MDHINIKINIFGLLVYVKHISEILCFHDWERDTVQICIILIDVQTARTASSL
jgi:hypothetical protein